MIDRLNQTHQITVPIGWFIKRATAADLDTEWFPTTAPDPAEWSFIFQACGIDLDLKIEQWPSRFRRIAESLTDKEVAGWPLDEATKHLAIDPKDPMLSPALSAMARRALIAAARSDDPDYEPNRSTEPPSEQTKAQRREVIDAGLGNVRSILRSPSPTPDGRDG